MKLLFDIDEVKQLISTQDALKDFVDGLDDSKVRIKNAFDGYIPATKRILKWCESTLPLLNQIINDDGPSRAQKNLLVNTLEIGIQRTWAAHEEFQNITSNFDNVVEVFDHLLPRIAENSEISTFQKNKVQNLNADIVNFKLQLEFEVQISGALEYQMQDTSIYLALTNNLFNKYPNLHENIHESINKLIPVCNIYRKRHE